MNINNISNKFRIFFKSKVIQYLMTPFLALIVLVYLLDCFQPNYISSYIIASATIMSAMVAIFISKTKETIENRKRDESRTVLLAHLSTVIDRGADSLISEVQNYRDFITKIQSNGMGQSSLKDKSFHFLESASQSFNDRLFDAILNLSHLNQKEASESYLDIVSYVRNAMFIKGNAHTQYENFIVNYNEKAKHLPKVILRLNNLYQKIMEDENLPISFREEIANIIATFNQNVKEGNIAFESFDAHRDLILNPLNDLLIDKPPSFKYFGEFVALIREHEMVIDKMEQIQKIVIEHFTELSNNLEEVQEKLSAKVKIIKQ